MCNLRSFCTSCNEWRCGQNTELLQKCQSSDHQLLSNTEINDQCQQKAEQFLVVVQERKEIIEKNIETLSTKKGEFLENVKKVEMEIRSTSNKLRKIIDEQEEILIKKCHSFQEAQNQIVRTRLNERLFFLTKNEEIVNLVESVKITSDGVDNQNQIESVQNLVEYQESRYLDIKVEKELNKLRFEASDISKVSEGFTLGTVLDGRICSTLFYSIFCKTFKYCKLIIIAYLV